MVVPPPAPSESGVPATAGRRLGPDARRAQLVAVGLALAKTMHFDEITAEVVARAGGVSKGLVFHYFPSTYDLQAAKAALERQEAMRLESLKAKIESIIEVNPLLKKYKNQLLLDITSEGLRIQIVDEKNRPMFALAKAELQPYTREILHVIGMVLNEVPNKIGLSGHTDSTPYYSEAGYSNWELSADRANASRREMVQGGLGEDKVLRVVGLASAAHLDRKDPFNPINRRISIIVMNKRTEEAVMRDAATLEVPAQDAQTAAAGTAAAVAK